MSGAEDTTGTADEALKRTRNRTSTPGRGRHPLLVGRPSGVWHQDVVGKVRGYPRTQEAFDARCAVLRANREGARKAGKMNRHGVPDGWAGQKKAIREAHVKAAKGAPKVIALMTARGHFEPDNYEAEVCLREAMKIALCELYRPDVRLAAIKMAFAYVQAPPTKRQQVEADPMAWLEELASDAMMGPEQT